MQDLSKGDPTVEDVALHIEEICDMSEPIRADHQRMMPGSLLGIKNVAKYVLWTPGEWLKVLRSGAGWAAGQLTARL